MADTISVKNLVVTKEGNQILKDISVELEGGRIIGLLAALTIRRRDA